MDRAAFLRSLSFLRPLPHGAWDGVNDDEEQYSGSTVTPPTPSKNNVTVLFEESLFAVSIEPHVRPDERIDGIAESCHLQIRSRKRGGGDGLPATRPKGSAIGPAFFQNASTGTKNASTSKTAGEEDAMEVEPESDVRQENEDAGESDMKRQINSDPSLCTFDAAIMKKLPSAILEGEPARDGVFSTPNRRRRAASDDMDSTEPKALMFRFGNRFVFQVDASAIVSVKYEPSHYEGVSGKDDSFANANEDERNSKSPPPKRKRTEGGGSSHAEKASVETKKIPPSLVIAFGSCSFRVFFLENKSGTAADTDRIWGTLAKTVESIESRIVKARSVLMQHFEIENKEKKRGQAPTSSWKMAPPGSGLAFHAWPESFESSSFHSNTLTYAASTFSREDWSCCLGKNQTIPSTISSPQKSNSASKASSSGTHVEHGQKEHISTKNVSSECDIGENDNDENNDAPNHESELTHESEQHEKDDAAQLKRSRASSLEGPGRNVGNSEAIHDERSTENGEQTPNVGASKPDDDKKETGRDGIEEGNENTNPHSLKHRIYLKYHFFEKSATHMDRAMDPAITSSQWQTNGARKSHLSSCAETLSSSYLTTNELMNTSEQCENDIENVTSEMERVLEKMFPSRGRKSNAVASGQSEDFQMRIEELMTLRKEAVAAKLALLMTPKR